jgi:hypothetical protein
MYIMATVYFVNPSHQSMSGCVSLMSLLGNSCVSCIHLFIASLNIILMSLKAQESKIPS